MIRSDYAFKFIIKTLMYSSDSNSHINAIQALQIHNISLSDPLISPLLMNETKSHVIKALLSLPSNFLPTEIISYFLESEDEVISTIAVKAALSNPNINEFLPTLIYHSGNNCEINDLHLNLFKNSGLCPIEFIGNIFSNSKEKIHEDIIDGMISFDPNWVLNYLIYPRMEKIENWRIRYNALKIFEQYVCNDPNNNNKINKNNVYMNLKEKILFLSHALLLE